MLLSNPSHVFISPLSYAVPLLAEINQLIHGLKEAKNMTVSVLSSVITHCLVLYHCSNLTCCCYYL